MVAYNKDFGLSATRTEYTVRLRDAALTVDLYFHVRARNAADAEDAVVALHGLVLSATVEFRYTRADGTGAYTVHASERGLA